MIKNIEKDYWLENNVRLIADKRLLLAEDESRVELTENNYRMLVCIIEGETSKEELLRKVWSEQNGVVSDSCYYGQVHLLRKALVQVGISGDVIKTIPRKGIKYNGVYSEYKENITKKNTADTLGNSEGHTLDHLKYESFSHIDMDYIQKKIKKTMNFIAALMTILSVCWLVTLFFILFRKI